MKYCKEHEIAMPDTDECYLCEAIENLEADNQELINKMEMYFFDGNVKAGLKAYKRALDRNSGVIK